MINNNKFSRYLSGLNFFEKLYNKNLLMSQEDKLQEFTEMSDQQICKLRVTAMQGWLGNKNRKFNASNYPSIYNSGSIVSGDYSLNSQMQGGDPKRMKKHYELYNKTF